MKQLSILVTLSATIFSQTLFSKDPLTKQASWQQRVDHNIKVELDAGMKILRCSETILYTNNSPDVITEIPMHIWPNAFSSKKSAYGKEALVNGNNKFLSAKKEEMGYLDSLDFRADGVKCSFEYQALDIVVVKLAKPLNPGSSIQISTPFRVKLPFLFSRMGYRENLISATQWYPKPAVYDANGWNTFSYLEQGEYYSEFGNYDVEITLPQNYILGATGELQNEDEREWLSELADGTAENRDEQKKKTLHFIQSNVPDFAWFCDPKFSVGEAKVKLPNGEMVHTYALLDNGSKGSPKSVLDAIETALVYYSQRVGNYPYKYCTAVIGGLKAAGGMEYPMITICTDASEGTIIHEVGHNWFQCMLGNQERRYPWMDESINTFYQNYAEGNAPKEWTTGDKIDFRGPISVFHIPQDFGIFQEGNLHSEAYQGTNYGTIVYVANPLRFSYLQEVLGKSTFDSCMHRYFQLWQYKHPLPDDMQEVFEKVSGRNMTWFFDGLLGNASPDVAIKSVKKNAGSYAVSIKNKGNYTVPIKLEWKSGIKKDHIWLNGNDTTVQIPKADHISLNPSGYLTERNMFNNDARTSGIFKTANKLKITGAAIAMRGFQNIWITGNLVSFNAYDGYTPGIVISNLSLPRRNWEWWLLPSYGIKSKSLVGIAGIQRNIWFKKGVFSMAEISVSGRSFGFTPDSGRILRKYNHVNAEALLILKRKKAWVQNSVFADFVANRIMNNGGTNEFIWPDLENGYQNNILRFGWKRESHKKAMPARIYSFVESGKVVNTNFINLNRSEFQFAKFHAEGKCSIPYSFLPWKMRGARIKGFATGYLWQQNRYATKQLYDPVLSGANGANDYGYRNLQFARSANMNSGGFWSNQLLMDGTGVRMLPNIQAGNAIAGVNLETGFIPKVPLELFFDATLDLDRINMEGLFWAGGLSYSLQGGSTTIVEINLPLVYSSNFNSAMNGLKWYQGVNFKLNIFLQDPVQLVRAIYR